MSIEPLIYSHIIKMSIEPLICSHRRSNLFLKELIFRCSNINLLILLMRMILRAFLASEKVAIEALDPFSFSLQVFLNGFKNQFPPIICNKFLSKILLPFLFKYSFLMPRCSCFMLSFSIKCIFF